ncbi:MAG: hypothetical protein KFF50_13100 [Desulfatitalea sp.]|nr:hypothetical protein [Desulfatitalea sp.]
MNRFRSLIIGAAALLLVTAMAFCVYADGSLRAERTFKRESFRERNGAVRSEYHYVLPVHKPHSPKPDDTPVGGWSLHMNAWSLERPLHEITRQGVRQVGLRLGYLQYTRPKSQLSLNLGRQLVRDGITPTRLDAMRFTTNWGTHISTTLFAGLPPSLVEPQGKGGSMVYGGRATFHGSDHYAVAFSYQGEKDGDAKAAAHLNIHANDRFSLSGLSGYGVAGRTWRDHSYLARLGLYGLRFAPTYQNFQYRDFSQRYRGEVNRFRFITNGNEMVEIAGSDIVWQGANSPVRPGVRGRRYTYELRREEAYYIAGLLTIDIAGGSSVGFEAGRMDGESPVHNHHLYRGYANWRNPLDLKGFLRMETHYTVYDEPVSGKDDDGLQFALSAGSGFWRETVEIKLSGTYSRDPFSGEAVAAAIIFNVRG